MNKRILSIFVFSAALLSVQAQDGKGGISDAMLNQIKQEMEHNVLDWEPSLALFVPDTDPLRFYRRIAVLGLEMLTSGGKLYFEINRAFGKDTVAMLCETGYRAVRLQKDISHNDRFVIAEK